MLKHLGAVITDSMARPWVNVRWWTQGIWDAIERGKCRWNSHYFIQEERVRMSYGTLPQSTPVEPVASVNPVPNRSAGDLPALLCRDFNSPQGCVFSGTHETLNVKHIHACAYCDSLGRRSAHSFQRCRARQDIGGGPSHHDNRAWQSNHRQQAHGGAAPSNSNQHYNGSRGGNYHGSSAPKNA